MGALEANWRKTQAALDAKNMLLPLYEAQV
jgi:hypothetical protein